MTRQTIRLGLSGRGLSVKPPRSTLSVSAGTFGDFLKVPLTWMLLQGKF